MKIVKKLLKRSVWVLVSVFLVLNFIIVSIGQVVAQKYQTQLNGVLGLNPYKIVDSESDEDEDTQYVKSNYMNADGSYNHQAMRDQSLKTAHQAAVESTVILWNNNDALPLQTNATVSLFGIASWRYLLCEYGSGRIMDNWIEPTDSIESRLKENGVQINETVSNAYKNLKNTGKYGADTISQNSNEYDSLAKLCYQEVLLREPSWTDVNGTSAGNVTTTMNDDVAIMTITRISGEDTDTFNFQLAETKSERLDNGENNYMDLAKNEAEVLSNLQTLKSQGKIKKIVLLINASNAVQFKNIKNYDIDACLWTGVAGNVSHQQVADVLTGKANPSGRLTDTYVNDAYSAPAVANFGDFTFTAGSTVSPDGGMTHNDKYVVYQEGIYVGYRYYETRYADTVLGQGNANGSAGVEAGSGNWSYSAEVAYPFGFGLSYTQFEHSDYKVQKVDGNYQVSMTIKNVGTRPGKDVMQVYLQKPYTEYDKTWKIEKAAVELVGFAKTKELGAGEEETLTVTVKAEDFKTYDAYGKRTYILEAGDYYIAAGTNAHDALNNILAKQGKTTANGMDYNGDDKFAHLVNVATDDYTIYSKSSVTGYEITNQFDNADINLFQESSNDQTVTYLSRNDWQNTFPTTSYKLACRSPEMIAAMQYSETESFASPGDTEMPSFGKISTQYGQLTLAMLMGVPYESEYWDALLDQLTWEDANKLISSPRDGATSVSAPGIQTKDGPFGTVGVKIPGFSTMCFPCEVNLAATWNVELIEEVGVAFGHEVMHSGYTGLYGPGANIHRSATFSGRNAEYYSEDGFISGKMLSAECQGLQSAGIIVFSKHFLLNDMERNRYGISVWANEQAIREIYLKAFEAGITEGNMNGIMSSFNRIGGTWSGRHQGLLTEVLRNEWGFNGVNLTDASVCSLFGTTNPDTRACAIIAGQDQWMGGADANFLSNYRNNALVAQAMREACHRILYARVNSNAMNGVSTSSKIVYVPTWWENAIEYLKLDLRDWSIVCVCITVAAFVVAAIDKRKSDSSKQ